MFLQDRSGVKDRPEGRLQGLLYHLRQLNICEAVDESLAEASQFLQKAVVVLLDHLVLLLNCPQVTFHRGDLLSCRKVKKTE